MPPSRSARQGPDPPHARGTGVILGGAAHHAALPGMAGGTEVEDRAPPHGPGGSGRQDRDFLVSEPGPHPGGRAGPQRVSQARQPGRAGRAHLAGYRAASRSCDGRPRLRSPAGPVNSSGSSKHPGSAARTESAARRRRAASARGAHRAPASRDALDLLKRVLAVVVLPVERARACGGARRALPRLSSLTSERRAITGRNMPRCLVKAGIPSAHKRSAACMAITAERCRPPTQPIAIRTGPGCGPSRNARAVATIALIRSGMPAVPVTASATAWS